LELMRWIRS